MKLLLFIITFSTVCSAHPIHLSVTNLEYFEKGKYFQMSIRLFVDDFETILNYKNNIEINLGKQNELKEAKYYINQYITHNFFIEINDKNIPLNNFILTDYEIKDVSIWITYKIKYRPNFNNLKITNTLMFDLFSDQKNMLIYTQNNNQYAIDFDNNKPEHKINLQSLWKKYIFLYLLCFLH